MAFLGGEATASGALPRGTFDQYQAYLSQHGREQAINEALSLAAASYEKDLADLALQLERKGSKEELTVNRFLGPM